MEFSTYDADHDKWELNTAAESGGGFWWEKLSWTNVNGHYRGSNYEWWQLMCWVGHKNLKKSQLMIRPAA